LSSREALIDLEIRIAFQEDAIAALDGQLQAQQRRIDLLEQRYRLLLERIDELLADDGVAAPEPPPPHY
jgi:SlyX protein